MQSKTADKLTDYNPSRSAAEVGIAKGNKTSEDRSHVKSGPQKQQNYNNPAKG